MKIKDLSNLAGASLLALLSACGGGGSDAEAPMAAAGPSSASANMLASAAAHGGEAAALQGAVSAALRQGKSDQALGSYGEITEPVVEVQRRSADGDWAFGGAYFPIPGHVQGASPVNALFVAQRVDGVWAVTLEDAENFHEVLQAASKDVTTTEERHLFASRSAALKIRPDAAALAQARDVGLSLPYRQNDASWGMWGVHGDSGTSRPYNSIDFMAGDGRVLASRAGVAYRFCTNGRWPFIKIVHDNGFTTGYYHLRNVPSIGNGQKVNEGAYLGDTGVELPCGGSANGNHVHWSLWNGGTNGRAEPVNGKVIGGWTWYESSQAYSGYAERNGKRINVNGKGLVNYGHGGGTAQALP